ncbi:hypothetical protein TIFTF001_046607 [Ficus carica]|uniref:Glycosyltransferase n=1 Tax=Ficus carica TaxID=3494 RepID=A0AA87ZG68_FICCA|nr:hypothetical protein TIFTF001_046606 [Ficus carica]GMN32554.1 hypothetical protein TIFTF001_046607 [Ficus carica]
MINQSAELVFVPHPGMGHLISTVEIAKLLVARDSRLFITVLVINSPLHSNITPHTQSFLSSSANSSSERIKFIHLPEIQNNNTGLANFLSSFFEDRKPLVRDAVRELVGSKSGRPDSPRLAGFVVDMFSTAMMDVADEFGVPSYVFFTSGAGLLSLMSHVLTLSDEHGVDITDLKDKPDSELFVPGFLNPIPAKFLPAVTFDKAVSPFFLNHHRRIKSSKGILVNTFLELESRTIESLSQNKYPPIYPVGPILNLDHGETDEKTENIVSWLDKQPPSSVVFLCFGSQGSFGEEQVREIALALERSGVRFLWSLRVTSQTDKYNTPTYNIDQEVLPEGFLDRTAEIGKIIGWAPQVTILAHPAVGGFVSHCGWNSTLESLWFGVPIATWPLYAEQQYNAFKLVKELELSVEIKMDYVRGPGAAILRAEEIEGGIRSVMEHDSDLRKRVKVISAKSKKSLLNGGSSFSSLGRFIEDVKKNMP